MLETLFSQFDNLLVLDTETTASTAARMRLSSWRCCG